MTDCICGRTRINIVGILLCSGCRLLRVDCTCGFLSVPGPVESH